MAVFGLYGFGAGQCCDVGNQFQLEGDMSDVVVPVYFFRWPAICGGKYVPASKVFIIKGRVLAL